KRKELIGHYLGLKEREINKLNDEWTCSRAYPLITYTDGGDVFQRTVDAGSETKEVRIIELDSNSVIPEVKRLLEDRTGYIGIILNTVKRVQDMYALIRREFPDVETILLHSSFLSPHRVEIERTLVHKLGKNSERKGSCIIIGTQVLEQSLD